MHRLLSSPRSTLEIPVLTFVIFTDTNILDDSPVFLKHHESVLDSPSMENSELASDISLYKSLSQFTFLGSIHTYEASKGICRKQTICHYTKALIREDVIQREITLMEKVTAKIVC